MGLWSELNHTDGQALADLLSVCRPSVGRTLKITCGKNHGKVGRVFWHGVDRFSHAGRYGDSYAQAAREVSGRYGYRVGVLLDDGSKVFAKASDTIVCVS